jgi:ArsR family transcriptional regulator
MITLFDNMVKLPYNHFMKKNNGYFKKQALIFKALANETRLIIVDQLYQKECTVTELTENSGLDQSTISKHLTVLFHAGIVENRKDKNCVYYRLLTPCVIDLFNCTCEKIKAGQNGG